MTQRRRELGAFPAAALAVTSFCIMLAGRFGVPGPTLTDGVAVWHSSTWLLPDWLIVLVGVVSLGLEAYLVFGIRDYRRLGLATAGTLLILVFLTICYVISVHNFLRDAALSGWSQPAESLRW
jgi:hypothetical protein